MQIQRLFREGDTAIRRDTFRGKVWTASPHRVVRDTGEQLVLASWPGVESLAPTTWIEWLLRGDEAVRRLAAPNLAAGRWELGRWTWRKTVRLRHLRADRYFSVDVLFEADRPAKWTVNFERPFRRTSIGVDTFDLFLDLEVAPDLASHVWKDEDEYKQARRLGVIGDAVHARVKDAREQALALIDERDGPFAEDWRDWHVDPNWPTPVLPSDALEVPVKDLRDPTES